MQVGQALSARPDLLPKPYLEALAQLQDQLPPFETATALALIEEDLGRPVSFSCYKQPADLAFKHRDAHCVDHDTVVQAALPSALLGTAMDRGFDLAMGACWPYTTRAFGTPSAGDGGPLIYRVSR